MSVGNYIRVKSWSIKCLLSQEAPVAPKVLGVNGLAGFIDIYFGKLRYDSVPVGSGLNDMYQDGTLLVTPTGDKAEMMIPMNKNMYIVYWHKRIKVGTSTVATTAYRFTIPCTKYILRNRKLYYGPVGGGGNLPISPDASNCSVWATFHPSAGVLGPAGASDDAVTPWSMQCTANATYHVGL